MSGHEHHSGPAPLNKLKIGSLLNDARERINVELRKGLLVNFAAFSLVIYPRYISQILLQFRSQFAVLCSLFYTYIFALYRVLLDG